MEENKNVESEKRWKVDDNITQMIPPVALK